MISPKEFLEPAKDLLLIPFYLSVAIFLIVYQPFLDLPEESFLAALCKALPVWCLAGYIFKKRIHPDGSDDPYVPSVMLGLLLSGVGDILMLFRSSLMPFGVFVFSLAHFMYIVGLKSKQDHLHRRSIYLFVNLLVVMFLGFHESVESTFDKVSLVGYFGLVLAVGAMAACRYEKEESLPALWGVLAAAMFIVSDSLVVIDTYALQAVSLEFVVMVLYYGSQLGFALSTTAVVKPEVTEEKKEK